MLHRPFFLPKRCPSSPGPQDDELPLVLVSIRSANSRVPQPDPNVLKSMQRISLTSGAFWIRLQTQGKSQRQWC